MSAWRRVAIEKMPGLTRSIAASRNGYDLWINLRLEMRRSYESQPIDDQTIASIYAYGRWCLGDARNDTLATAAIVCFYEHLPTDLCIRADVGRWLSVTEFEGLKNVFGYFLTPAEVTEFTHEFLFQKKLLASGQSLPGLQDVPKRRKKPHASVFPQ